MFCVGVEYGTQEEAIEKVRQQNEQFLLGPLAKDVEETRSRLAHLDLRYEIRTDVPVETINDLLARGTPLDESYLYDLHDQLIQHTVDDALLDLSGFVSDGVQIVCWRERPVAVVIGTDVMVTEHFEDFYRSRIPLPDFELLQTTTPYPFAGLHLPKER